MKKLFLILLILNAVNNLAVAQSESSPINWISFEEAEKKDSVENRPFLIDVYTDWCGWCKRMMFTTFQNKQLADYINNNFYCVRFDAETKDTVNFLGKEWVSDGHNNNLAKYLLNNRLSYPTIVYLDKKKNIMPIPGYMEVKDIEPILAYFAEDLSQNINIDEFRKLFVYSFPDNYQDEITKHKKEYETLDGNVKWLTFSDMKAKYEKEPKPILIDIYVDEKYRGYVPYITLSSMIHERSIWHDTTLCNYINQNYYPVRMEATTTDSIYWFGADKPFVSMGQNMPNQLTHRLLNGNYKFPAVCFFDKNKQHISTVSEFFSPELWTTIAQFYGQEAYKSENFDSFYRRTHK